MGKKISFVLTTVTTIKLQQINEFGITTLRWALKSLFVWNFQAVYYNRMKHFIASSAYCLPLECFGEKHRSIFIKSFWERFEYKERIQTLRNICGCMFWVTRPFESYNLLKLYSYLYLLRHILFAIVVILQIRNLLKIFKINIRLRFLELGVILPLLVRNVLK